jgi:hypothetical protein
VTQVVTKAPAHPCATLFTIAKLWKQPRCPTTDKWIKKIYIHGILFNHKEE